MKTIIIVDKEDWQGIGDRQPGPLWILEQPSRGWAYYVATLIMDDSYLLLKRTERERKKAERQRKRAHERLRRMIGKALKTYRRQAASAKAVLREHRDQLGLQSLLRSGWRARLRKDKNSYAIESN
jgi:hypothetical protein